MKNRKNRRRGGARRVSFQLDLRGAFSALQVGSRVAGDVLWAIVPYAAVAVFSAVLPMLGLHAWRFFSEGEHFQLQTISIRGNALVSEDEVLRMAGIREGVSAMELDPDAVREGVERHPLLRSARVELEMPHTLTIDVEERTAAAVVALGRLYFADERGVLFKEVGPRDPVDHLPVVTGLEAVDFARTDKAAIAERTVRNGIELARQLREHPLGAVTTLSEAHWDPVFGWSLVLAGLGVEAQLGLGNTQQKLDKLAYVLADLERRGARARLVVLDDERDPGRVVVRTTRRGDTAAHEPTDAAPSRSKARAARGGEQSWAHGVSGAPASREQ
jgi:cell division protein FtsQ